jgi:hypothetical protein
MQKNMLIDVPDSVYKFQSLKNSGFHVFGLSHVILKMPLGHPLEVTGLLFLPMAVANVIS